MSLEITFQEDAFQKVEESTASFDKPEFKKFNMRFNNLDLAIIDAIAKRDGISRSQIINGFIREILEDFILNCPRHEALVMTRYAESLSDNHTKSDKNFKWDLWYTSLEFGTHPENYLDYARMELKNDIKEGNASKELLSLIAMLKKSRLVSTDIEEE